MTTATTATTVPTLRAHIDGSLVDVRVTLRAAYDGGEVEDVRADGHADARPGCDAARAELLKIGFTEAADGRDFVARGAAALWFWREGMASLPDAWELFIPDALLRAPAVARPAREAPDPERVRAFASRFSLEHNDARAVAMLSTTEGRWFVAATFGLVEYAEAAERARFDRLLARMLEQGGASAMQQLEADLAPVAVLSPVKKPAKGKGR